jgi:hypothetical protein
MHPEVKGSRYAMDDIESRILDGWRRVKPRLMDDAAELERRLARARDGRFRARRENWV